MLKQFASLAAALQMLLTPLMTPESQLQALFQSGVMLRLHVVAPNDAPEMQLLKLQVRNAVQAAYNLHAPNADDTMLKNTQAILPQLTAAAEAAARDAGFSGIVRLELGTFSFGPLPLSQTTVPAGDYPALVVYLGDAQGRNWWGLIDPDLALVLSAARMDAKDAAIHWDWSWHSLWQCLLHGILPGKEAAAHAS